MSITFIHSMMKVIMKIFISGYRIAKEEENTWQCLSWQAWICMITPLKYYAFLLIYNPGYPNGKILIGITFIIKEYLVLTLETLLHPSKCWLLDERFKV